MNKFLSSIIALFMLSSAQAQNPQEFEIIMNGKKEKVTIGKQYKFITPKGDTVVYQLNDIPKNVTKDQPKINQNTGQTATNIKEEKTVETKTMTDIERLKEEARQKAKGTTEDSKTGQAANEVKPADTKKSEAKTEVKESITEKIKTQPKADKKIAEAKVEVEEKQAATTEKSKYEYKKYYIADQTISAANIASKDTLKFITTDLSVYKDFPSLQFGSNNNLALCYDYVVMAYHGYDQELIDKHTTRYKVCQVGNWSESRKTADVYLDTKQDKRQIRYSIVQLDEKNLVLVKR